MDTVAPRQHFAPYYFVGCVDLLYLTAFQIPVDPISCLCSYLEIGGPICLGPL